MTKVYLGGIPVDTKEREIEDEFRRFGKLEAVWLARNPPGFAFVTYEDARDADEAIRSMDGKEFLGKRIRVEKSRERKKDRERGRKYFSRSRSRSHGRTRKRRDYRKGEHRVRVTNLSSRVTWRELKDFLRDGGDICYTDVRDGEGIADFMTREDMKRAIRKLDGEDLEGRAVRIDEMRARSHSRSRSRSKSGDRRNRGNASRSRSRSRSRRSRTVSKSRSRSRSRKRYRR